mmetsp:Transcript_17896/g.54738  ORF Transcript_17896/g.54738 Transcript_17896/m.54738 type:complete len:321 (+) Transcript_17896:372-1334(+)
MPAGGVRAVERDGDGVAREPPKSGGRRGLELVADGDPRGRGDAERGVSKNDFPQVGHDQRRGRGRRDDSGRRLHRGESRGLRRRLHRAGVSPLGGRRHGPRAPLRPRPLLSVQPRLRVRAERQLLPQVATVLRPPPHLQRLHDPVRALPRSRRLRLHVRPRRPRRLQLRPRRPRRRRRRRQRRPPPSPHPRRPPRRRRQPPRRLPRTPLRPLLQARRPRPRLVTRDSRCLFEKKKMPCCLSSFLPSFLPPLERRGMAPRLPVLPLSSIARLVRRVGTFHKFSSSFFSRLSFLLTACSQSAAVPSPPRSLLLLSPPSVLTE